MGRLKAQYYGVVLAFFVQAAATPRSESFIRSAVEKVPEHERIATPYRASVESIPLRNLRNNDDEHRVPLRDAVEKRPDPEDEIFLLKSDQTTDAEVIPEEVSNLKNYYGAAAYLNKEKNNERLQLGNANLHEMQQTQNESTTPRIVVCYMESWAAYRAPPLAFTAGLVPNSCTHLHYAFAGLHPHTYAVTPSNQDYDLVKGGYRIATGLKKRIPGLKVIISVGGDGTDRLFSEMVKNPMYRRSFVESAVEFLREHEFDGLDLHWTYPGDEENYNRDYLTSLLYELREKFSSYGFLLSTIIPPFRYSIEDGYDIEAVSGVTDYTILEAWDMTHGKNNEPPRRALQHSALHRDPGAAERDRPYNNIEFVVKHVIRHGMAADKLVLGIPLYGRSYTLAPSTLPAPGATTEGWGSEGQYTQTKGMLSYFEICMAQQEGLGSSATDENGNTYAVFDNQWVSYDTPKTVAEKMKFIISSGLAGAAAWAIDMDDFRGLCGPAFPILKTIAAALNGEPLQETQSSLKMGFCDASSPYLASDEKSCAHFQFCSGRTNFRLECEDDRLYDPSTGFCGHQDPTKCMPGQNLRISVQEATRLLSQAYETDFEWNDSTQDAYFTKSERFVASGLANIKKMNFMDAQFKKLKKDDTDSIIYNEFGEIVFEANENFNKPVNKEENNYQMTINKPASNNYYFDIKEPGVLVKEPNKIDKIPSNNPESGCKNRNYKTFKDNDDDSITYNAFGEILFGPNNNGNLSYNKEENIIKQPIEDKTPNYAEIQTNIETDCKNEDNFHTKPTENFTSNVEQINNDIANIQTLNLSETVTLNPNTNDLQNIVYNQFGELVFGSDTNIYNDDVGTEPNYVQTDASMSNYDLDKPETPAHIYEKPIQNHITNNQENQSNLNIPQNEHNISYNDFGEVIVNDTYNSTHIAGEMPTSDIFFVNENNEQDQTIELQNVSGGNDFDNHIQHTYTEMPQILISEDNNNISLQGPSYDELPQNDKDINKRVICYMTSWAFYRRGEGKFVPEHIDTRLCTHVVYAYASLVPDDLIAKEYDPWADLKNNLYERVTSLKDVRVMLGIGGWTDSAGEKYSRLVSSSKARANFIEKLIPFLRMHNFQGLHFDWNYPVCWQSNCKKGARSDKANFAQFIQELSKALHGAGMELGIALSGYKEVIESAYDLPILSKYADFLTAMTYDYHGGWEPVTGHHTPLVPPPKDPLPYYSIEYAIKAIISGGVDPKKLNLGLAFYGQSYRLADSDGKKNSGSPASGPGEPGEFTKQPGMLSYYEICYRVKNLRWKVNRQPNAGPFTYQDNQWIGYDDPESIAEKVKWALSQGLGGVTAWAIDLDDFNNRCCAEPSPLLRAAGRALGRDVPPPPNSACERPPEPVTPSPPTTTTVESDGSIVGSGGNHDHHGQHQTSTTWPSWKPPTTQPTSAQTWWPPATTISQMTTTTTMRPTKTTSTTTAVTPSKVTDDLEDARCVPGEYHEARYDCESYLQCVGGRWQKNRCANGLHWNKDGNRCDWPSFAKCTVRKPSEEMSSTTTTAAPTTTQRPPSTTTRRTSNTTTKKPTTTTSTKAPTTTSSDDSLEHKRCNGHSYKPAPNNCNAYLHCDGSNWISQNCAPGLHWSAQDNHCDWPKYAKCEDSSKKTSLAPRPTPAPTDAPTKAPSGQKIEGGQCGGGDSHAASSDCQSYLQCVTGKWTRQLCPPGLHWDKRTMRCDWAEYAMCDASSPGMKLPLMTTKKPNSNLRPPKPTGGQLRPGMHCRTGTYHTHPRCDKFFVCVNSMLVTQSCAPGLVWNTDKFQCDFPSATSCTDRRQSSPSGSMMDEGSLSSPIVESTTFCENGEYSSHSDCTRYQHCIFGKFEVYSCSPGLHWNKEKQTCDWPKNAKCVDKDTKPPKPVVKPVLGGPSKPYVPKPTEAPLTKPEITNISTTTHLPHVESSSEQMKGQYKLVCYYTNWAWYRPGIGKYAPEDIDPSLCTHIVYGFAVLGRDGLITAHDSWADYDNRFYERVVAYKRYGIKVSLALGGWNDSADDKYSKLVNSPSARHKFVKHVVEFIEKYNFDGLDLDWEYPKCWQVDCSKGPDSDKEGFAALVRELSHVLKPKGLLLSSAVSPNRKVIDLGYNVPVLDQYMDWIAVMTYDYHGQWDKKTGHVAPLYYHPEDENTYFNANYTMHYWIEKGARPSKLVMGMPLYGQSFTMGTKWDTEPELLARRGSTGLNAPVNAGGQPGEYTKAKGFLSYMEICDRLKNHGWTMVKDPFKRMGPYAYKGDQWVSFDDVEILKKKVDFIKSLKLGGGMVWALDLDDFRNRCGQGKHPLLNTIKNGLLGASHHVQLEPMIDENSDDNDIVVTPAIHKRPSTTAPYPYTEKVTAQLEHHMESTIKPSYDTDEISADDEYKVICYYTNWAWYRPGSGKYSPSDVDTSLCTHIIYAFAVLDATSLVIKPHDSITDIDNKFYEKVVAFKSRRVKVLLGLGGWNDSAGDKYSRLVNSPSSRRTFIVHALDFLEQYGFDGLDLDWEYPKCWQVDCEKGPSSDKQGFAKLVQELRAAFTPKNLLLSAAVSASKRVIDAGYDVPVLSESLDWIAVMTYDYHGQWDKKTGHVAPMYARDDDDDKTFNANFTINYWIKKGASGRKLVMGIPLYGQSFSLSNKGETGLGVPTYAGGDAGDETRARGFLAFYEICERIRIRGWKVVKDPSGNIGPYATRENQWVSFDDDFMVRHKAQYVRAMGLGGGMVWAMDLDDFTGKYCGCGKSPLLSNINHVLRGKDTPPPCPLEEIQSYDVTTPMNSETPIVIDHSEEEYEPPKMGLHDSQTENGNSLEGKQCLGNMYKSDPVDCRSYYLCNNGHYVQLSCPNPLHWNINHCDFPENSNCYNKALIRLTPQEEKVSEQPIVACYFTNWAYYRSGNGSFGPEQIDSSLCTHIIYSWAGLDADTYKIVSGNPELDIENDFFGKVTDLRMAGVKVILGVGGLEDSLGDKWNKLISNEEYRNIFVKSVLKFLEQWKFEGLHLSWQYPICTKSPCTIDQNQRANFSSFIINLSKELRQRDLEFSMTVTGDPKIASSVYDNEVLTAVVDWISIAANDFNTVSADKTEYLLNIDEEGKQENRLNSSLEYWLTSVPSRQLVIGIPLYARTYTLRDAHSVEKGATATGPGEPGIYTAVSGFMAYYEICSGIISEDWTEHYSSEGTFAISNNQWATYLHPEELHQIVKNAVKNGVRGAAIWALDLDDWSGRCKCGRYPLLHVIRQSLNELDAPLLICNRQQ